MRDTLKLFTTESLFNASSAFLSKLNLKISSTTAQPISIAELYGYQMPKYLSSALDKINASYYIGAISDESLKGEIKDANFSKDCQEHKYTAMFVFACDVKSNLKLTRTELSTLTRALNRIACNPVILLVRQGNRLSLSTCEHIEPARPGHSELMGKVSALRKIDCAKPHAGHKKTLETIAKDIANSRTFDDLFHKWLKSFSIDIISDNFFKGYTGIYADIIALITNKRMVKEGNKWVEKPDTLISQEEKDIYGKPIMEAFKVFDEPEKAVRDYIKKLMGRLVFIQFLQKKGWMGCPEGNGWTNGDEDFLQNLFKSSLYQDDFVDQVLEPLFADINTDRSDNGYLANSNLGIGALKIPYLNGGLFEPDEYDKCTFKIPSKYFWNENDSDEKHPGILKFFSNYYFTIDENAPDDVDVAVDPEMLSRIFENLLEDNKDKGAFYTPKEIVEYMCREALIAYLQTDVFDDETKKTIRQFVTLHDVNELKPSDVALVEKRLKEVKICDPAIGSGAFPMGMLRELFTCRRSIEEKSDKRDLLTIKKEIIQNSIYGVDIEKGAVDIARLRFWLSLIVDEETPQTLPNMDFKIMQGNSLLEQFRGVALDDIYNSHQQTELAFDEESTARVLLKENMFKYFNESNHNEKQEIRKKIDNAVKLLVKAKTNGNEEIHQAIDDLDLRNNQEFFLWHTWFNDVLADKKDNKGKIIKGSGGFDIVIGNPPYFNIEKLGAHSSYANYVKKVYSSIWQDKSDILFYFFALAMNLSKNIIVYITSNAYPFSDKAKKLRNKMLEDGRLRKIENFERYYIFNDAKITTCITSFFKQEDDFKAVNYKEKDGNINDVINFISDKVNEYSVDLNKDSIFALADSNTSLLNRKIDGKHQKLNTLWKIGSGMQTAANEVFCFDTYPNFLPNQYLKHRMSGDIISKYVHDTNNDYMLYIEDVANFNDLPESIQNYLESHKESLKNRAQIKRSKTSAWWKYTFAMHKEFYKYDKIWCPYRSKSNEFALDESSEYIGLTNTTVIFDTNKELSLKYLLALLNSKVLNYRYKSIGKQTGSGIFEYFENGVGKLPIPTITSKKQQPFITLVDQILTVKKNNPDANTSAIEDKIDRLVYELYGLTNAEVKIIDPNETISGPDDELFIA